MPALNEAEKALRKAEQEALEKQVKKEIARIKRTVRAAEKRGYVFSSNAIPTIPKSGITAGTLRKVQKITPASLYKKASYTTEGGKRIKGTTRRKQERSEAAKKGAVTRMAYQVLRTIRQMIDMWAPKPTWNPRLAAYKEEDKNLLERVLNGAISELGEKQVALNMEKQAKRVIELGDAIIYGGSGREYFISGRNNVQKMTAEFAAIIRDKPLTVGESKGYTEYGENDDELPL